jgi:lipopolysaccharide assembly protein A
MNDVPAGSYRPAPEGVGRGRFAVRRSRLGGWWVALIASAVVLLLLLIFVLQNGQRVRISFLGARASLPLGVALLLAAIGGVLIVAIPGTGRIIQLRRLARRRDQASSSGPSAVSVDQTKTVEADEPVEPGGTITEAPDPHSPASPDAETSPERS